MKMSANSSSIAEYNILEENIQSPSFNDAIDFKPSRENIQDLKAIQNVYSMYEDQILSLNEVLTEVLEFYRKFVPFK